MLNFICLLSISFLLLNSTNFQSMRNFFVAVALLCIGFTALSQDDQQTNPSTESEMPMSDLKPTDGYWGVSFDLSGLINNISLNSLKDDEGNNAVLLRHYVSDEYAVRLGFGLNSFNQQDNEVSNDGPLEIATETTSRQTSFYIAPGIEKHFLNARRLDPYIGANLGFGIIGKPRYTEKTTSTDTIGVSTFDLDSLIDGGFTFGLNVLAGFNYFVSDKFSIGAEYRFGYNYRRSGGDYSTVIIETPVSGSSTTTRNIGSIRSSQGGFLVNSTAGITLSYFFTRNKPRGS